MYCTSTLSLFPSTHYLFSLSLLSFSSSQTSFSSTPREALDHQVHQVLQDVMVNKVIQESLADQAWTVMLDLPEKRVNGEMLEHREHLVHKDPRDLLVVLDLWDYKDLRYVHTYTTIVITPSIVS